MAAVAAAALSLSVVPLGTASAAPAQRSSGPAAVCGALAADPSPDSLYGFIGTKPGACQSTITSVGLAALGQGAFPSRAAAVGNCKGLEAEVGGYPYTFYGDVFTDVAIVTDMLQEEGPNGEPGLSPDAAAAFASVVVANYNANVDLFTAKNRNGCVQVLKGLHSGDLFGLLFAPPQP